MEYHLAIKRNKALIPCWNIDEPQKHYGKWMKPEEQVSLQRQKVVTGFLAGGNEGDC